MNPLARLNQQYIAGEWRDGSSSRTLIDRNPFNGSSICEFRLADLADLVGPGITVQPDPLLHQEQFDVVAS